MILALSSTSTSTGWASWSGIDCFYVGRLKGTDGAIWQHRHRHYILIGMGRTGQRPWHRDHRRGVFCKPGTRPAAQTSKLARRVAQDLKAAGWTLEHVLSDNANEFKGTFIDTVTA